MCFEVQAITKFWFYQNPDMLSCGLLLSKSEFLAIIKFKLFRIDFDAEEGPYHSSKTYVAVFPRAHTFNECLTADVRLTCFRKYRYQTIRRVK